MRRRIYHGDVGGKAFEYLESTGHEGLNEPLINSDNCGSSERFLDDHDEEDDWREKRRKEELAWTNIFSRLIAQWAQWFATIVLGSGTWLGVFLHRTLVNYQGDSERVVTLDLSPRQEERLQKLQRRLEVPFDGTRVDHQDALRDLWRAVFPECELIGLISEQWKEMGWQGTDPSTDFRNHSKDYYTNKKESELLGSTLLLWQASTYLLCLYKCWTYAQYPCMAEPL